MPTGKLKTLIYRAVLPFSPSPRGQMAHWCGDEPLRAMQDYEALLKRHHVLGASLLLMQDGKTAQVLTSTTRSPVHASQPETLFRVASITKMATALTVLSLVQDGLMDLDAPVCQYLPGPLPEGFREATLRQMLSHTSGLRDHPAMYDALAQARLFHEVLALKGAVAAAPGQGFAYSNLGFGLLGCMMEQVTGQTLEAVFQERLFQPLGMRAHLDASGLNPAAIMPITRLVSRSREPDTVVTPLGRIPLASPDPERHFGHTAGSMYTDAPSLSRLLSLIHLGGMWEGKRLFSRELIDEMRRPHASYGALSPTLSYGLGLLLISDPALSDHLLIGHQGFAYGCADGAFFEADTGRQVIFLNGGCSELRTGRLGKANFDILRYGLRKELPQWR
ncbi:MAG: beta-lactamase family protein [Clostridia bacterium]|nr:beta-lactamase family protein [Clostridia bacterium]